VCHYSLSSSTVQLHDSLRSKRAFAGSELLSIVKMATVLEEYNSEEQCCVVHYLWPKGLMQRILVNKYLLFTVRNVCLLKRVETGSRNSPKNVRKS
jgi:hypothetical protein